MSKQGTVRVLTAVVGAACALALSACGRPPDDSAARAHRSAMNAMDAGAVQPGGTEETAQPTAIGGGPAAPGGASGMVAGSNAGSSMATGVGTNASRAAGCESSEAGVSDPDCDEAGVRSLPGAGASARVQSETNGDCPPGANMNGP